MSHDDCLKDWSDIKDITLSSSGAVLLVVLMGGFPKYAAVMVSRSMISMPCLMMIAWGIEVILSVLPRQVLVLLTRRIYDVSHLDGLSGMIYIQTKIYEDWYRLSSNIKVLSKTSEKLQCL
jgi:hypothetical protein